MKIAIVQDELVRRGGGEQVTLAFHRAFPHAPVYTLAYKPQLTYPEFKKCCVVTSWFQKITFHEQMIRRAFFPLGIMAMRQLDVTGFDVVLMSSTHCAKYVRVSRHALVINFCHCPFRLAWYPESYYSYATAGRAKKWLFNSFIEILRKLDYHFAQRVNYFLANTEQMAKEIKRIYSPKNKVSVIHPPVSCSQFHVSDNLDSYYLVVSRLEYYKRVDLAIKAFNKLELPLIVVGEGTYRTSLIRQAKKNILFKKGIEASKLASLYSRCQALIFPQREDYGITPLEANASGRPVIAFGEGGVLETMKPYRDDEKKATALFFHSQTVDALVDAVRRFQSLQFDSDFLRAHAMRFDVTRFVMEIKTFVTARKQWTDTCLNADRHAS